MRKSFGILVLLTFLTLPAVFGSGIDFFHGTWDEALEKAKAEDKLIFVDAYTAWCGPCKRMAKNVFPQEEVGEFFNSNFVNVKLDMEKGEGRSFRSNYKVSAFPTLLFIDGEGEAKLRHVGGLNVEQFIQFGENALTKVDYSKDYATKYEEGDRSPELLRNYALALKKSRKPAAKVANEYLRTQTDMSTKENLEFLVKMTAEADSRMFDLLIENRSAAEKLVGKENVLATIENACYQTVNKAVEFQTDFLLDEANEKMKAHYPAHANEFNLHSQVLFYGGTGKTAEFISATDKYLKKTSKDKNQERFRIATQTIKWFEDQPEAYAAAEKWIKKAVSSQPNFDNLFTLAQLQYFNNKPEEALSTAEKALNAAKEQGKNAKPAQALINLIKERT